MINLQLTNDELDQVKNLIENTIFQKDVLEDSGLLPKTFNLNIMEFLLIRLKMK